MLSLPIHMWHIQKICWTCPYPKTHPPYQFHYGGVSWGSFPIKDAHSSLSIGHSHWSLTTTPTNITQIRSGCQPREIPMKIPIISSPIYSQPTTKIPPKDTSNNYHKPSRYQWSSIMALYSTYISTRGLNIDGHTSWSWWPSHIPTPSSSPCITLKIVGTLNTTIDVTQTKSNILIPTYAHKNIEPIKKRIQIS